jgi:acetyl esterase/lipase
LHKLIPFHIDYLPNIVYGRGYRDLRLSIVRPKEIKNKKLPAIIYIHGDEWLQNIKDLGIVPLMQFVNRGYIGVAVEYRLSREAKFPAQIEDIKCAILFLSANASLYSIDTAKLVFSVNQPGIT